MPDLPIHIIVPLLVLLMVCKEKDKKYIFMLLPLSIFPDMDTLVGQHRVMLHSLLPTIILLTVGFIYREKIKLFLIASVYMLSHTILDIFNGGVVLFYPFIDKMFTIDSYFKINKTHDIMWKFNIIFENKYSQSSWGNAYGDIANGVGIGILFILLITIVYYFIFMRKI